jgi:hypothetical protein
VRVDDKVPKSIRGFLGVDGARVSVADRTGCTRHFKKS